MQKVFFAEMLVHGSENGCYVFDGEMAVEGCIGENDTNILAIFWCDGIKWFVKKQALAAIGVDESEDSLKRCAFSGAIAANEAGNGARLNTQGTIEGKARIVLLQVIECDHFDPSNRMSNRSRISSSLMPRRRPFKMACSRAASTSLRCSSNNSSLLVAVT